MVQVQSAVYREQNRLNVGTRAERAILMKEHWEVYVSVGSEKERLPADVGEQSL